MNTTSHLT